MTISSITKQAALVIIEKACIEYLDQAALGREQNLSNAINSLMPGRSLCNVGFPSMQNTEAGEASFILISSPHTGFYLFSELF